MAIQDLFSRQLSSDTDEMQRQAKVQCNSPCRLSVGDDAEVGGARVRELSWYGMTVDRVPREAIDFKEHPEIKMDWELPREFGQLCHASSDYVIQEYHDVIGDRDYLLIEVRLPESDLLENIRSYLLFRNRSFIRNARRKNKAGMSKFFLLIIYIPIAVLATFLFFQSLWEWLKSALLS
jgi:hypothetical protein